MEKSEITENGTGYLMLTNQKAVTRIVEEMNGLQIGFDRIRIPSSRTTVYELSNEDGTPDTVKEFTAVILYHHTLYAYYKQKYTGGAYPPDCVSYDGMTGKGKPGGSCKVCPYNRFDSGENGAKACKNRRRIYVLREGELFPLLLSLPTGSLKGFTKYLKRMLIKGYKSNQVVTRFSLIKATNSIGETYSQAQFTLDRVLTEAEQIGIDKLSEKIKAYSRHVTIDPACDGQELAVTINPDIEEILP